MHAELPFFRARVDLGIKIIMVSLFVGMLAAVLYNIYYQNLADAVILFVVLFFQQLLIFGIIKTTNYTLEEDTLYCRSLIFKRRIPYSPIRKIQQNTSMYAGLKMSTSFRGIVIHYNKYDELFISPVENDRFVALLKERNSGIVIA
jgi:hypothetical protein